MFTSQTDPVITERGDLSILSWREKENRLPGRAESYHVSRPTICKIIIRRGRRD